MLKINADIETIERTDNRTFIVVKTRLANAKLTEINIEDIMPSDRDCCRAKSSRFDVINHPFLSHQVHF